MAHSYYEESEKFNRLRYVWWAVRKQSLSARGRDKCAMTAKLSAIEYYWITETKCVSPHWLLSLAIANSPVLSRHK